VADLNTPALARHGVRTALRLMRGEPVPERLVVEDLIRVGITAPTKVMRPH